METDWICDFSEKELQKGQEQGCFCNSENLYQIENFNRLSTQKSVIINERTIENSYEKDTNEPLISAVEAQPSLYDHRLPLSQRSRHAISNLWEEIFWELKGAFKDIHEIETKWRSLRDRFVREHSTVNIYRSGTGTSDDISEWKY